jgi:hypothetical protein
MNEVPISDHIAAYILTWENFSLGIALLGICANLKGFIWKYLNEMVHGPCAHGCCVCKEGKLLQVYSICSILSCNCVGWGRKTKESFFCVFKTDWGVVDECILEMRMRILCSARCGCKAGFKGAVFFQLKTVICDLWENGKTMQFAGIILCIINNYLRQ